MNRVERIKELEKLYNAERANSKIHSEIAHGIDIVIEDIAVRDYPGVEPHVQLLLRDLLLADLYERRNLTVRLLDNCIKRMSKHQIALSHLTNTESLKNNE